MHHTAVSRAGSIRGLAVVPLLLSLSWGAAEAQGSGTDSFPAPTRPVSRIVAPRWIAEDDRDAFGEAELVMELLRVRPGQRVADIGAGDGYYIRHLTERVGPTGVVYGQDIEPRYLDLLRARVAEAGWTNVVVVEGTAGDPRLPAGGIDIGLMIHMYHEISEPFALLHRLSPAFRDGGRLAILDQDAPTDRHGTPPRLLACELRAMGYDRLRTDTMPDGAYLMTFRAPDATRRTRDAADVRTRVAAARCRP